MLAFDYDGTLAPIVRHHEAARMRKTTRELLMALGNLYPVVVVSGRARRDMLQRMLGVPVWRIVGSHGLDWGQMTPELRRYERLVQRWRRLLQPRLSGVEGVEIEDKRVSLSIHYRQARYPSQARIAIADVVGCLKGARVFGGKRVFNVVPRNAPDKGYALEALSKELRSESVLYIGDDVTDEAVFSIKTLPAPGERVISIRIGKSSRSAADFYIDDQLSIDDLLTFLLECRSEIQIPQSEMKDGAIHWTGSDPQRL